MNYIVTKNTQFFRQIGQYNYCTLAEMKLGQGWLAYDSETTHLDPRKGKIFAIQLGTGRDNYLIDLQEHKDESKRIRLEEVVPFLRGRNLIMHNGAFDYKWLLWHGYVHHTKKVFDTMVLSKIIYNGQNNIRHDFGATMLREIKVKYDKTEQKNIHKVKLSTATAIQYCFNDVDRLIELHEALIRKAGRLGVYDTYRVNRHFIPSFCYMMLCGLPISEKLWREKMAFDLSQSAKYAKELTEYIYNLEINGKYKYRDYQGDMFSSDNRVSCKLSSGDQMIPVFLDLGIYILTEDKGKKKKKDSKPKLWKKKYPEPPKGMKYSLEEGTLQVSDHEFVKIWLNWKEAEHNVTSFGQKWLDRIEEGRVYTEFNMMVDTSRISVRSKKKGEDSMGGLNFLNLPANKETRQCFLANVGHVLVVADYEGQENVVNADITQDEAMLRAVNEGADLHCAFARVIFPEIEHLTDKEIKELHDDKRTFAKAPRFAFAYGGSGFTVSKSLNISRAEGDALEAAYKELHKGIFDTGKKILEESLKTGYIQSCSGWLLRLPDWEDFQEKRDWMKGLDKEFWADYREGKAEYLKQQENKKYEIQSIDAYDLYTEFKGRVGRYFSLMGQYLRLCLNNPIQTTGAHQTKAALTRMFDYIVEKDHLWEARIANSPYDEIVMEVKKELALEYKPILGQFMREEGDKFLKSGLVKMGAEANIGWSWQDAKKKCLTDDNSFDLFASY